MHLHPFRSSHLSLSLTQPLLISCSLFLGALGPLKSSLGKYLPPRFIFISFVCYFLLSLFLLFSHSLSRSHSSSFYHSSLLWLALPLFVVIFIVHFTFYTLRVHFLHSSVFFFFFYSFWALLIVNAATPVEVLCFSGVARGSSWALNESYANISLDPSVYTCWLERFIRPEDKTQPFPQVNGRGVKMTPHPPQLDANVQPL